jgi:hypothetical protein
MADQYFRDAQPVLAACCHLSVGDGRQAASKLGLGGEIELAFAVQECMNLPHTDDVMECLALRAERLQEPELALQILQQYRDSASMIEGLCIRYVPSESDGGGGGKESESKVDDFYADADLRARPSFASSAELHERNREWIDATRCYLLARMPGKAVEIGLARIKEALGRRGTPDVPEALRFAKLLHSLPANELDTTLRSEFLAYMAWLGAQQAMWRDYTTVVPALFSCCFRLCEVPGVDFCISVTSMLLQEAEYMSTIDIIGAVRTLRHIDNVLTPTVGERKAIASLLQRLARGEAKGSSGAASASSAQDAPARSQGQRYVIPRDTRVPIVVGSSNLPAGSNRRCPINSLFSSRHVQGPAYVLDDQVSCISLAEALMWARCNPFSPLNTGRRINPF